MLYSREAHGAGGSGFFFNDDSSAPPDAISVSDDAVRAAINLPAGSLYTFSPEGELLVAPSPDDDAEIEIRAKLVRGILDERARRLGGGYDYDFGDERGVHRIGTTDADMAGWDEISKAAAAYIAAGDPDAEIGIVTDTGAVAITAAEWPQVLIAAHQARQPIWMASFALQAMDPIPDDFADDRWWISDQSA